MVGLDGHIIYDGQLPSSFKPFWRELGSRANCHDGGHFFSPGTWSKLKIRTRSMNFETVTAVVVNNTLETVYAAAIRFGNLSQGVQRDLSISAVTPAFIDGRVDVRVPFGSE